MILVGDNRVTLSTLEDGAYQAVITSPPYFGLRLYGDACEEIGKERALDAYVASIVDVMRLCRAKLRDDGVAWCNIGDSYAQGEQRHRQGQGSTGPRNRAAESYSQGTAQTGRRLEHGSESGNALLVPFRVAMALQQDGWTLRAMLPWVKIAAMPESVQSRPSISHEYVLFLTKRPSGYFYDADAVRVAASATSHGGQPEARRGGTKHRDGGAHHAGASDSLGAAASGAGRSYRSSDTWRAGAREAAAQLLAAADGTAIGLLTNDDAPAALVVNPKGSGIQHFAMWPTRLVAPMIMAGTPEAGSCSVCGAPWARVVETERIRVAPPSGNRETGRWAEQRDVGRVGGRMVRTGLGFRPSCEHADAPARPAIVLDPFAGAGTTLAVAEALGREGDGCELYQKNADLYPQRKAIVAGEVADYLRERGEGEKAASAEADPKQLDMWGGS